MKYNKKVLIGLLILLMLSCNNVITPILPTNTHFVPTDTTTAINETKEPPTPIPPSVEPTIPPLPTQSLEDAKLSVALNLETNLGCELPCWWNITPGKSEWRFVSVYLTTMAISIDPPREDWPYAWVVLPVSEDINSFGNIRQMYAIENGTVQMISSEIGNSQRYSLSNLLQMLGKPSEIRIFKSTVLGGVEQAKRIYYYLFFPGRGVFASLNASTVIEGGTINGCPGDSKTFRLVLWSPDDRTFLDLINTKEFFTEGNTLEENPTLEEISGMDIDTFYDLYSKPDATECFPTSEDAWIFP